MPSLELLWTSLDAIRANKLRSFLTTLGVVIGVLSVILLVSLGEGLQLYLTETFAGIGTNLLQITPGKRETKGFGSPPSSTVHKLTKEDEAALRQRARLLDGVTGVVQGTGTLRFKNRRRDTFVLGVGLRFDEIRQMPVEQGRFFTMDDISGHRRIAVVGHTVLHELFGAENALGKIIKVADGEFRVIGITASKGTTLGIDLDDLVLIPNTSAMDLFAVEGFSSILAPAKDKANVKNAMEEIEALLKSRHNNQVDFAVVAQDDMLATINGILGVLKGVLLSIASVSLLVGGIGIANIMLVSVRERTREIGVRRAVGAKKRHILIQFLLESVVISLLGGAIGLLLGASIIALGRTLVPGLPIHLSGEVVATAVGFSIVIGILSGVIPARRAASLDPVEALRYE